MATVEANPQQIQGKSDWLQVLGSNLNPKGWVLLNTYTRYLLLHGARKTTKTNGALNRIARHLFEVDGARMAFVAITRQSAKSGAWETLTNYVLDKVWIEGGSGMKWGADDKWDGRPKLTGDTRMTHFRIRNMHGGFSYGELQSLDNEREVEAKFKNTNYSIIYVSEGDLFKERKTFATLQLQLRGMGPAGYLPTADHMMIVDCNPPEEGTEHPLHDMFFKKVDAHNNPIDPKIAEQYQAIAWNFADNIWMSKEERHELEAAYSYDDQTYRRLILGEWTRDLRRGLFADVWLPNIHIGGSKHGPDMRDWETIVPQEGTYRFWTGWDPGDVSHAAIIGCTEEIDDKMSFLILDELFVQHISLSDFAEIVCEKMNWWEKMMKALYKRNELLWHHYADDSVVRWRAGVRTNEATIVEYASIGARGRGGSIRLHGVPKPAHSIAARVRQVRALLFEKRLFVSVLCNNARLMFENLMAGKATGVAIEPGQSEKHIFDALSYPLSIEAPYYQQKKVNEPLLAQFGIVQMPLENSNHFRGRDAGLARVMPASSRG